jgi:hypothetical protein
MDPTRLHDIDAMLALADRLDRVDAVDARYGDDIVVTLALTREALFHGLVQAINDFNRETIFGRPQ